jgi:hypothetical protein
MTSRELARATVLTLRSARAATVAKIECAGVSKGEDVPCT